MFKDVTRKHIENFILGSILNAIYATPLDEMELVEMELPYTLFKSTRTSKMVAKAIYNMREQKIPVDGVTVIDYIEAFTPLNEFEYMEILEAGNGSFLSVKYYLEFLERIDKEQHMMERLRKI